MKIKIIDLLNLVYNKKAPKNILYKYCEYELNLEINDYKNKDGLELFSYLFQNEEQALFLEVEILEEKSMLPDKIDFSKTETQKEKNRLMKNTINKIIDYLKKEEQE